MMDKFMSVREAAERLGISPNTMRAHFGDGTVEATKRGRKWVTTDEWISAYEAKCDAEARKAIALKKAQKQRQKQKQMASKTR